MKTIPLVTQGWVVLVDDEDFVRFAGYRWFVSKRRGQAYAGRKVADRVVYMHREVLDVPNGLDVDHLEHRPLAERTVDNRRQNLRVATRSQNNANQRKRAGTSSRFKGVSWDAARGKWYASIKVARRKSHLGRYSEEDTAALAYDAAALVAFGEFALLNFLPLSRVS